MRLRDVPPISDSTMDYAGRSGMNLPQARSVEESANRVRQYVSGGQAERRPGRGVLPVPGPIAPTPQAPMTARDPSPLAGHFAGVTPDVSALHRLALGALSPHQFGSGF